MEKENILQKAVDAYMESKVNHDLETLYNKESEVAHDDLVRMDAIANLVSSFGIMELDEFRIYAESVG